MRLFLKVFILFVFLHPIKGQEVCHLALIQPSFVWGDVQANLVAFNKRMLRCEHSDLIILPELFASGCDMRKKDPELSLKAKEEVASHFAEILEKMKSWSAHTQALVIGSTIYKEEGKYYNRLLAVFPDGSYQYYDKHNCFKKEIYTPGDKQLILSWKGHRIATYICYDLRFPEWSQNRDRSYDTALYIANWPDSRRDDWNRLLRERAIENQAYVIGVNCVGTDLAGLSYAGDSFLLSPQGDTLGYCEPYKDEILFIELPGF